MVTLQKTFKYNGDLTTIPFEKVLVQFKCPVFDYSQPGIDDQLVYQQVVSTETTKLTQELKGDNYKIDFPTGLITGDDEVLRLFLSYTAQCMAKDNPNINGLSLTVDIRFSTENNLSLGNSTLNAIYFIKSPAQLLSPRAALTRINPISSIPNLKSFLESNIFLLNKNVYDEVLPEFKDLVHINQDLILLTTIQKLVEATDMNPISGFSIDDRVLQKLPGILTELHIENQDFVVEFFKKHFNRFFDFPLFVEEIKTISIAGTFHVKTSDNAAITLNDLQFYSLLLDYTAVDNPIGSRTDRFDWPTTDSEMNNNTVSFTFNKNNPIVVSGIQGLITVRVKSFDGAILWLKDYHPEDPILKEVIIEVTLSKPNNLNALPPNDIQVIGKKLRGQLVGLTKKCPLKDATVIIQAKKDGDEIWRLVGAATADSSGNFSMPYPYGVFKVAQAIVSLTPDSPADIPVNLDAKDNQTISDAFLYLLVTDPVCDEPKAEEDCDCHTPKKAGRLPDQADLINSDEYTQDIGGGCINLSTPNRTLSEYNYQGIVRISDPDVANYTLRKITKKHIINPHFLPPDAISKINTRFELVGGASKIKRSPIDLNNPIQWQDSPDSQENLSFYQAVTIATGHILHYKSVFKADGYSLGNLLYSLPLAPGQKKQIVVIDAAHSLLGTESQSITQGENLAANLINERMITDQLGGGINEALQGSSSASTSGVSAGLGIGANIGVVSGALGVAGGYANSNSSASQNSSRDTSQFFGEKLRQAIMQNADSYRQLNASVVTSVQEGQHYAAQTEVVANHNHCHALTMMYFEVLRHYAIYQELANVEECVFVPLLMTNFTCDNIYKWADVLAKSLLPIYSNTYLQPYQWKIQHPLLKAFDANERIKTNYVNVDFPLNRYCDDTITSVEGSMTIRINLPRPKTRFDRILSLPVIKKTETSPGGVDVNGTIKDNIKSSVLAAATGGLSLLFGGGPSIKYETLTHEVLSRAEIFDSFMTLDENYDTVPPAQCIRVHNFDRMDVIINGNPKTLDFFDGMSDDKKLWDAYANVLGITTLELLNKFSKNVISDWDTIFFDDIAPDIVANLIKEETVSIKPLANLDLTVLNRYSGREQLIKYNFNAKTTQTRADIPQIDIIYSPNLFVLIDGIETLKKKTTCIVESLTINYTTAHYAGRIFSGYVGNDLLDNVSEPTPLNTDEKRFPRKEDLYIVNKLIEHLNSNLEYYNKMLWYNLDVDRRYMLLDGFDIQVFDDLGAPAAFRSLASVVKNQLITVTGNSLVFPVAPGYRVSQSYILIKAPEQVTQEITLFDHYKPLTPIPPYRISVPSRGVFLEAIQGVCDACEKIKENSAQDWTKFTTDEPTPISAVTPIVPTVTDWKAAFKDFATPLINIQNAPATPAPGAGLAGLSELLGKAGIFKDITGLDANQQNVLKTFLSNQENAKAFAEMAKNMALQGHNTENSDKIMDTLKTAKDSGAISQDDYGKLVKEHIQKQIDGGATNAQIEKEKAKPTLTDAAVKAADQGKNVKAQKTDKEGNIESVDISSGQSDQILSSVKGNVPKLKQENDMACWATAATMMVSWKKGTVLTVPQVLTDAGAVYLQKFNNGEGLLSSEKEAFISALNMVGEAPANYTLQQYIDWLNTYGPLWVTTDSSTATGSFSPHARILTKISGTGSPDGNGTNFTFTDPGTGTEIIETFTQFIAAFEQMVTDNSGSLFIQIVHFIDKATDGGEGSPVLITTIAQDFLDTVVNVPANLFKNGADIDSFFMGKTGASFNTFFANQIGNKEFWTGTNITADALRSTRFMNIWDNVANTFSITNFNLIQFLCLQSAIVNETGGLMNIPSEGTNLKDHNGLKYTYSDIPSGYITGYPGKGSYNVAPLNRLAFDLFNNPDFNTAHDGLTGASLYKNTSNVDWKGQVYPITETAPNNLPYVAQADFHKFRGRGYIQLTWRNNYLPTIDFILKYTGTNPIILKHQAVWTAGLGTPVSSLTAAQYQALKSKAATISTNEGWDELFQNTNSIIALKSLSLHGSGQVLMNVKTDLPTTCKSSILAYGTSLNGSAYGQKLFSRVMQVLNKIGNTG
ncbi:hypothetical protein H7F33_08760 [Pedobacter sp. PAMC26386]|nr:hypothetical protein H7F33_08760 [Pedobacter sp. PAMC26386]